MDPVTFVGLVAAVVTIVDALEKRFGNTTPVQVAIEYEHEVSTGLRPKLPNVTKEVVAKTTKEFFSIRDYDRPFADRIRERCLKDYDEAIRDPDKSEADVDDAYREAQRCVCQNIRMARRHPRKDSNTPDEFRDWYNQFNCLDRL